MFMSGLKIPDYVDLILMKGHEDQKGYSVPCYNN